MNIEGNSYFTAMETKRFEAIKNNLKGGEQVRFVIRCLEDF